MVISHCIGADSIQVGDVADAKPVAAILLGRGREDARCGHKWLKRIFLHLVHSCFVKIQSEWVEHVAWFLEPLSVDGAREMI